MPCGRFGRSVNYGENSYNTLSSAGLKQELNLSSMDCDDMLVPGVIFYIQPSFFVLRL